jgi:hypothetical protein
MFIPFGDMIYKNQGGVQMAKRMSVSLSLLVDLKVGDRADVKNFIERINCSCIDTSGEDVKILGVKILDRKLLLEGEDED